MYLCFKSPLLRLSIDGRALLCGSLWIGNGAGSFHHGPACFQNIVTLEYALVFLGIFFEKCWIFNIRSNAIYLQLCTIP